MSSPFDLVLGPIIIAAFFAIFFFGVITMQTEDYIRNHFQSDPLYLKCFVIILWFLQVLFTMCICQGTYTMSVTDFGETIRLLFTPWGLNGSLIVGSVINHSVQAFFVMRIYRVSGALYVSIGLWTLVACLEGASLKLAKESIHVGSIVIVGRNWGSLLSALFFGDACLDVVVALVLIYYLKKQSHSVFIKSTAAVLNRLVRYAIQTGLATSFVAMGAALSFELAPSDYIWPAFWITLPGSFTIALLANLNGRRSLKQPTMITNGTNPLESGAVIPRNVAFARDPAHTTSSQQNSYNITIEPRKHSADNSIYRASNIV